MLEHDGVDADLTTFMFTLNYFYKRKGGLL